MATDSADDRRMLINVQFLRFVAAVLVVLFHSSAHVIASRHPLGLLFGFGRAAGFAGVDIFFVISGFIMAWTTAGTAGGAAAWSFARRRAARIYSGYWPFFLLAFALFSWLTPQYLADARLLRSFLLWPTELANLLIPVSWTLIFEMWFYLLFTIIILADPRRREPWLWLLAAVTFGWALYSQFVRHAYAPGVLENMNVYEQYLGFPYLLEFLAGALVAAPLRRRPRWPAWTLLLLGVALFGAGAWINSHLFHDRLLQGYFILWRLSIFGSASVLLLAGMVCLEQRGVSLPARFSLLAGGASYAIYLSHTLLLEVVYRLGLHNLLSGSGAWLAQLAYIAIVAGIVAYSVAHYRLLERPLHRVFRRLLRV